jgi:hypothetical protein
VTIKNAVFWDVVALVRTDGSEERIASIIRVRRNSKFGTEDTILHSHRRENLKSYEFGTGLAVTSD